ncbi:copper resistance protein CopC [Sphingomonas oleivorans]|uniref:Copper resistance protein CopC n=1 Tax=Sphingomonas oleivorans TaxID=1735121 RepID=A0A2T5G0Q0_9SPHN|nr:copper homeostasis periplasmic binding protein CopC [Sphingomonas oleivorans]PTQ12690.1 copper resistance protein CopC [Sphingomonas oleivorans]
MKHLVAFAAAAFLLASGAQAHPKIVSASPAANAVVAKPAKIELHFSETLMPKLSGAEIVMTGMPGMAGHPPMKIAGTAAAGPDGKTLIVTPAKPLVAGSYRIDWYVVSADTHRITGTHAFSVK